MVTTEVVRAPTGPSPETPPNDFPDLEKETTREIINRIEGLGGNIETLLSALNAGTSGTREAVEAILASLQPTAPTPAPGKAPAPVRSIFPSGLPSGQSTSTNQLLAGAQLSSGGGTPAAFGFPLFAQMIDLTLRASADRRASIDQTINIARLFVELERVSPTRAASLATQLGLESGIDLSSLNAFGQGQRLAPASGGRIGSTNFPGVSLPQALSGRDLSFLSANPNVANIVADFAESVGLPDIFSRSQAGLIPTSGLLTGLAA